MLVVSFRSRFIPGWDCHGLPIENKALAELKVSRACFSFKRDEPCPEPRRLLFARRKADFHNLSPAEIRSAAKKVAEAAVVVQREEFELLGVMADWSKEGTYRTLGESHLSLNGAPVSLLTGSSFTP